MITQNECKLLYSEGAFYFKEWPDEELPFPAETNLLLKETGLPSSFDILGIHFLADPAPATGMLWQIGYEWDKNNPVLLEAGSGHVYTLEGEKPILVNTNLKSFLFFLEYFGKYQARQPVMKASCFTFEQMQEKLANFKNRAPELKKTPAVKRYPTKEAQQMREYFKSIDRGSLGRKRWWPLVIEQVRDGIL